MPQTNFPYPVGPSQEAGPLKSEFEIIGQYEGAHQVLDTPWEQFISEFKDANVASLLEGLRQKRGKITVLDEGCGSSLTLFEAIEAMENGRTPGSVEGYGITASTEHLSQPVPEYFRKQVLERDNLTGADRKRLELVLGGVLFDTVHGYHRYTPRGNLIQIEKADVHSLDTELPGQKFDLIYSTSAYPHFANPRLAFEQSCNTLNEGGVLLIDSLPIQNCPTTYIDDLKTKNPDYEISIQESEDPFNLSIVVHKRTSADLILE